MIVGPSSKKSLRTQMIRDEILRTALHLYTENGYFNTSVHDIQRVAGVSIGSIYNHFGSKEAIAKSLYVALLADMEALVDGIMTIHRGAHDRCRAVVLALFRQTEEDPEATRFILSSRHREFLPEEPSICSAEPFVKLRAIVQEGMEKGELRQMEPWVASATVFGPAIRLIHLRLDGLVPEPLPAFAEDLWQHTWRGVGLKPAPAPDAAD